MKLSTFGRKRRRKIRETVLKLHHFSSTFISYYNKQNKNKTNKK